jgi:hypothetical protein
MMKNIGCTSPFVQRLCLAAGVSLLLTVPASATLVINELHYNPAGSDDLTEFIEFHNTGDGAVSLAGWTMSAGVDFAFSAGATIPARGFCVLAQNPTAFAAAYPGVSNVYGPFANGTKLDNSGERVALSDAANNVVCEVTYSDDPPWPTAPDGDGPSLELRHPMLPPQTPSSWAASTRTGGSPGASNTTYLGDTLVIDHGSAPAYPPAAQPFAITATVVAPTTVVALTLYYHTNQGTDVSAPMADDGAHQDGGAGDATYGVLLPGLPNATYLYYYYHLQLADGSHHEFPTATTNDANSPWLLLRLSYNGLETQVAPRSFWQTISTTGVATASRLYAYLGGPGQILLDDVSITLGGTQYVPNGSFASNTAGWTISGNHSGSLFDGNDGNSAPGCLRMVATDIGDGSPGNNARCDTSPALAEGGPVYTLSFAYRAPIAAARDWYTCLIGATNWHRLCLNELLPWNTTGITDEDGTRTDWLELYNAGTNALNLRGVGLSDDDDDPFLWQFPDLTLPPHGFVLVYASEKNRTNPRLHTNFRLDAQGETVYLTAPDGTRLQTLPFGAVPPDVARGSMPDGAPSNVYFTVPTPGGPNTTGYHSAIAETPQFSRPGGFFSGTIMVTVSVHAAGAAIRYTLNNTVPTEASPLCTNPFVLTSTTRITARAFQAGLLPGPIAVRAYYAGLPGYVTASHLPIVVVDTLGAAIPDEPKIMARMGVIDRGPGVTNYITDPFTHYDGAIGIELRGKSSQGFPKDQYGIETRTEDGEDLSVNLLGFPAESDFILNANYSDKTLMRNVFACDRSNGQGRYATRTRYCEMILNGQYNGVYIFMEKIKRDGQRVDIAKLRSYMNSAPDVSGGYILKIDKLDSYDTYFYTSNNTELIHVYPKGADITPPQKAWITAYMNAFEAALQAANYADPTNGYAKYIDVPSFVDHYILIQATRNIDGFRYSSYLHKDREGKLVAGPPWDFDLSCGNANYADGWLTNGWYTGYNERPFWWGRLLQDANFTKACRARWNELRKGIFMVQNATGFLARTAGSLNGAQQRNFARWPILGQYVWPNWYIGQTYAQEVAWMQQWVRGRIGWLDSQWPIVIADFRASTTNAIIGETITFSDTSIGAYSQRWWSFGDGSTSFLPAPGKSYSSIGTYTVQLTISNAPGGFGWIYDRIARTNYIMVIPEPGTPLLGLLLLFCARRRRPL